MWCRLSASQVKRPSPADGADAKKSADAVYRRGGWQDLDVHAAGCQFVLQASGGLHLAVGAGSDDKPLRIRIKQRL